MEGHVLKTPLGSIEPHEKLLEQPSANQKIYKVMSMQDFLGSVKENYLYFRRVDSYKDFSTADAKDGEQLPLDKPKNQKVKFQKSPSFTYFNYCEQSRSKTYACCFSLENSKYLWDNYGNGDASGKVCLQFNFGKLRNILNLTWKKSLKNPALVYRNTSLEQIFSINYGLVRYVDRTSYSLNLPNSIQYIFLKDQVYANEKELRISLSALGIGIFPIEFPSALKVGFDYKAAIEDNIIEGIICSDDASLDTFNLSLKESGIDLRFV